MRQEPSVLHLDCDAFFASVEQRQKPSLRGRPVLVGGAGARGVVATASYEARAAGCRSAMPTTQARHLCPAAVLLTPRFRAYAEHSAVVMAALRKLSPLVQPVGMDEAFVDLSAGDGGHDPAAAADRVRREIYNLTGLAVSVGLGRSKLVAKLASAADKPHGFTVVTAEQEESFLLPKLVSALWGVGPATERSLESMGVRTVADLRDVSQDALVRQLGSSAGTMLFRMARGMDERPVESERETKSVGAEHTFDIDVMGRALHVELEAVMERALARLRRSGLAARTVTVKLRLSDFTTFTRAVSLPHPSLDREVLEPAAHRALDVAGTREPARLLGVSFSGLSPFEQPALPVDAGPVDPGQGRDGTSAHVEAAAAGPGPQTGTGQAAPTDEGDDEPWDPQVTDGRALVGVDVGHERWGNGWISARREDQLLVRFEGPDTSPGHDRIVRLTDPQLLLRPPPPPAAPARLAHMPS